MDVYSGWESLPDQSHILKKWEQGMVFAQGVKNPIPIRILTLCAMLYVSFLLVLSGNDFFLNNLVLYLLPAISVFLFAFVLVAVSTFDGRVFAVVLFCCSLACKVVLVANLNTPQTSDFLMFYNAAQAVANGDFSLLQSVYFKNWGYNTGIVLYEAAWIKLFGNSLFPMMLANCAYIAGVNVFVYLMAKLYTKEKYARIAAVLYLFYPASYFLASVLTNQHIANLLTIAGLYCFARLFQQARLGISFIKPAFAGLFLALGNVMRPIGIICIAAIIVFHLLFVMSMRREKCDSQVMQATKITALTVLVYFTVNIVLSAGIAMGGINENGLRNNYPLWKFVVGLNQDTTGRYSNEDVRQIYAIPNEWERDRVSENVIRERLSDPVKIAVLMVNKSNIMWVQDDTLSWGFGYLKGGTIVRPGFTIPFDVLASNILHFDTLFRYLIFGLVWIGLFVSFRRREALKIGYILPLLAAMAYMGIHLAIEIQARYRDFAMVCLFILAAEGVHQLEAWYVNRRLFPNSLKS